VPRLDAAACAALLDELTGLAEEAAEAILGLASQADVRTKADGSPVTAADEAAEAIICAGLRRLVPQLPIISEEQAAGERPTGIEGGSYFLVDPLDGTREFIAGRDEYTINIALMTDGAPVLGIICAPALGVTWRGLVDYGADRMTRGDGKMPIRARLRPAREVAIVVSRSHLDARTRAYVEDFPQARLVQSGSSLKFCRVAEGSADIYPRLSPIHDWDIAAGHAILTAAGGSVTTPDGLPLRYGTPELLIPAFIACGLPIRG
jgi:3'(2'), 5'-bisphosphate nucleotidase